MNRRFQNHERRRGGKGWRGAGRWKRAAARTMGVVLVVAAIFGLYRGDAAQRNDRPSLVSVPSISYRHPNHIHGLGYDQVGGRLLVATHHGLFVWKDGRLFQFGDSRDDYMGFSLHPSKPNVIYTSGHPQGGGNLGVMKSEDGGLSFQRVFRGLKGETVDFHSMAISPANPDVLYGWSHGKIYRTMDGGGTWSLPAAKGLPPQGFCFGAPCFAADATDEKLLYAGTAAGLLASRDSGESWSMVNNEGPFAGIGVDPASPRRLFAFTQKFGLALSPDGGQRWQRKSKGIALRSGEFIFGFAFDPSDSKHVFAASPERVFRSYDRGDNWEKIL